DVAAGIDRPLAAAEGLQVLRGHVRQRPADERRRRVPAQAGVLGEVEVQQHRLAVLGQQDVGRLEVAMHDAAVVGVPQPVGPAARRTASQSTACTYVIRSNCTWTACTAGAGSSAGAAGGGAAGCGAELGSPVRSVLFFRSRRVLTRPLPESGSSPRLLTSRST